MKIAISSTGKSIESNVSHVFGRADYFLIVDTESKSVIDVLDNSKAKNSSKGAGVIAASLVAKSGIDMVFSGKIGPTASEILEKSLVSQVTSVSGPICEILNEIYDLCDK